MWGIEKCGRKSQEKRGGGTNERGKRGRKVQLCSADLEKKQKEEKGKASPSFLAREEKRNNNFFLSHP